MEFEFLLCHFSAKIYKNVENNTLISQILTKYLRNEGVSQMKIIDPELSSEISRPFQQIVVH